MFPDSSGRRGQTHQVLCSPLSVLRNDLLREPLDLVLDRVLHLHIFILCMLLQRARIRVKGTVLNDWFIIYTIPQVSRSYTTLAGD